MMDAPTRHKALLAPYRAALYDYDENTLLAVMDDLFCINVDANFSHPIGSLVGPAAMFVGTFAPLANAFPDFERRDTIVMAGRTPEGQHWVGCGGYYAGTFQRPFLDIPPTGHMAAIRFHEFFRFEEGRVVEIQALWDIPELMMQAGAWPMQPSLGREWQVPAPATQDGLISGPYDEVTSRATCQHIIDMLQAMKRHPSQGGPEVMEMDRFWHEKMSWYGPSGIGTGRGYEGFRNWHQIPFLAGMPDRGQYVDEITYHFFGDRNYAAVTGWPNMIQTISHDGWLGIPPINKRITMRSLDFWRLENRKIRENWVMVDLLDMYNQIGVDVLARMRDFNKSKQGFEPFTGRAIAGAFA
ncbi:MAG: ester cyclase [Rhizobiales bacterium]|nr:ester cyclase [Hyphomicrobiales bacterium]MBO6698141.1 ester cyclase [Hyphomicrobiales bacterium]MBO6735605.1 ester cyclase [Hyphomicrobiales bacterium]MBO6910587.1 ester cyclase [Hyphomicrobiales bacterium]MBO6957293.1 ester cyclase [Hyphomicrobiales bacterium]